MLVTNILSSSVFRFKINMIDGCCTFLIPGHPLQGVVCVYICQTSFCIFKPISTPCIDGSLIAIAIALLLQGAADPPRPTLLTSSSATAVGFRNWLLLTLKQLQAGILSQDTGYVLPRLVTV